jgi:hypothetical protein
MMEEIYQSRQCERTGVAIKERKPTNPHNGYYDDGRYYFDFPAPWFNIPTLNKAIALRRIDCRPNDYEFKMKIKMSKINASTSAEIDFILVVVTIHVNSKMTIDEALSTFCLTINNKIRENLKESSTSDPNIKPLPYWLHCRYVYEPETYIARFIWEPNIASSYENYKVEVQDLTDDFSPGLGVIRHPDPGMR